jgi:Lrp/AsnC family leucine-responsive transcriptional regulator
MKMKKQELEIVRAFRCNARESLTTASRRLNIPVSTIYDRLRKMQGSVIDRHVSLLNFKALGFNVHAQIAFSVPIQLRDALLQFLKQHAGVNSIYKTTSSADFVIEVVCKDLANYNTFVEQLEVLGVSDRKEYYIIDKIRRECFMTQELELGLLMD